MTEKLIYDTLMSQSFVDWYEGEFIDHVGGGEDTKSRHDVLKSIKDIFNVKEEPFVSACCTIIDSDVFDKIKSGLSDIDIYMGDVEIDYFEEEVTGQSEGMLYFSRRKLTKKELKKEFRMIDIIEKSIEDAIRIKYIKEINQIAEIFEMDNDEEQEENILKILEGVEDKNRFWTEFLDEVTSDDEWYIKEILIVGKLMDKKFKIVAAN